MCRYFALSLLVFCSLITPMNAASISGLYVEARTCDVWTGPCFANAEENLIGKHAVIGWKIDKGAMDNVKLDGLSIVAVVQASDTLGVQQTGKGRAILIVDEQANSTQKKALIALAKKQAGSLLDNVIKVEQAPVSLINCNCTGNACAKLKAGKAEIETRCLHARHDKVCGNESAYYPPLSKNVKAKVAVAVEHSFTGKELNQTWQERGQRGAYFGTFQIR